MYVFLDTEFLPSTSATPPVLLSLGLCAMSGPEFYGEVATDITARAANEFLRAEVLPQLGQSGETLTADALSAQVVAWLDALAQVEVQVCYDYHVDYDLFEELMLAGASKPTATLVPTHVGYLNRDPAGELASQQCFTTLRSERNLMQHHALADALALRAKFIAVHGE